MKKAEALTDSAFCIWWGARDGTTGHWIELIQLD